MPGEKTEQRKAEHLKICAKGDLGKITFTNKTTGFEEIDLIPSALPEISKDEVELETEFLGKPLAFPLIVSSMTGGCKEAGEVNNDIASACEELGIGMGVGSMRAMIENPALAYTYKVRDVAPNIFLNGNIGVSQLKGMDLEKLAGALNEVDADALAIHLNPAQEAVQKEGTTDFKGLAKEIERTVKKLSAPVFVKEVGNGISRETARLLVQTGIQAIDVSGAGGTNWVKIDAMRGKNTNAEYLYEWGVPTALAIVEARSVYNQTILASGGIRNGLDIAKALILGADLCSIALPVLRAQADGGKEGVVEYLTRIQGELRTVMFLVGAKNLNELKDKKIVVHGKMREWLKQRGKG
ncbi:MAG: type 2 isopentenyl-diphosphate Delta-isomerase [Candidatus Diapherotrites archaeon]|nr:type 2 isopentenyl-diphosphate Delta-isomerase [Candidatus Diapherotrites archaeon]